MVIAVEKLNTSGVIVEGESMKRAVITGIPGFLAVMMCHMGRYPLLPQVLVEV